MWIHLFVALAGTALCLASAAALFWMYRSIWAPVKADPAGAAVAVALPGAPTPLTLVVPSAAYVRRLPEHAQAAQARLEELWGARGPAFARAWAARDEAARRATLSAAREATAHSVSSYVPDAALLWALLPELAPEELLPLRRDRDGVSRAVAALLAGRLQPRPRGAEYAAAAAAVDAHAAAADCSRADANELRAFLPRLRRMCLTAALERVVLDVAPAPAAAGPAPRARVKKLVRSALTVVVFSGLAVMFRQMQEAMVG